MNKCQVILYRNPAPVKKAVLLVKAIAFGGAECFRRTCQPTSLPLDRQIRRLGLPEVWIWRSRPSGWAKCDCPMLLVGLAMWSGRQISG